MVNDEEPPRRRTGEGVGVFRKKQCRGGVYPLPGGDKPRPYSEGLLAAGVLSGLLSLLLSVLPSVLVVELLPPFLPA